VVSTNPAKSLITYSVEWLPWASPSGNRSEESRSARVCCAHDDDSFESDNGWDIGSSGDPREWNEYITSYNTQPTPVIRTGNDSRALGTRSFYLVNNESGHYRSE